MGILSVTPFSGAWPAMASKLAALALCGLLAVTSAQDNGDDFEEDYEAGSNCEMFEWASVEGEFGGENHEYHELAVHPGDAADEVTYLSGQDVLTFVFSGGYGDGLSELNYGLSGGMLPRHAICVLEEPYCKKMLCADTDSGTKAHFKFLACSEDGRVMKMRRIASRAYGDAVEMPQDNVAFVARTELDRRE